MKRSLVVAVALLAGCSSGNASERKQFEHSHDEPPLSSVNPTEMGLIGLMEVDEDSLINCDFWREGANNSSDNPDRNIYVLTTPYSQFGKSAEMKINNQTRSLEVQTIESDGVSQVWQMKTPEPNAIKLRAEINQVSEMFEGDGFEGLIEIIEPKSAGLVRFNGWCGNG